MAIAGLFFDAAADLSEIGGHVCRLNMGAYYVPNVPDYEDGLAAAPGPASPTLEIVSPMPGVIPGDAATAGDVPIVVDVAPHGVYGLSFVVAVVRYPGESIERVAFRGRAPFSSAQFRRGFAQRSSATMAGEILRLSILPDGPWPNSDAIDDIVIDVDAASGEVSDIAGSS